MAAMTLCIAATAVAQDMQLPQLPNDPETRVGKLDNGMTYYIRHNANPENRAEFYLATNVGALQEEPDQDGLAHFLEHMCFNGTKNFPDKGILNWLESIGASFGGNVNASTGVEQTIYLLNNIPLVRPTVVDTCLLIMHDYSHFVTCDPAEIDKERGVIIEEKRSRNDASWRINEKSKPYIFGDTKYATTTLIGTEENLRNFKPESLVNFYHTWYRPDLQALIVVGDVDVDEVEAKIKSIFADIPAQENPKPKAVIPIPDNVEPVIGVVTDPETSSIAYTAYWKSEATPEELNSTSVGYMTQILKSIISIVMNERFTDLAADPNANFVAAGLGLGKICETCEVVMGQVNCKDTETSLDAFETMMTEIEKMKRFGFTDSEIERAKAQLLSNAEAAVKSAATRKNSEFVYPLIYNFFDNEPYMDPETEYELMKQLMPVLTTEMINQVLAQIITDENLVVIYEGPDKDGMSHPTESQILEVIDKVRLAELEQDNAEDIPEELLDPAAIKAGKVRKTAESYLGSTYLKLSNGVNVYLYPSELNKDRIDIRLYKKGGMSLISDEDIDSFESNIWSLFLQNSGVSEFSSTTISKMLAGKNVSASPFINSYTHGVSATSTVKDAETAFQLTYLLITDPRFDQNEYDQGINQIKAVLPNLVDQSNYKLQEQLYKTAYNDKRHNLISDEVLQKASLQTIEKNYRALLGDVAGATVIISGDFKVEDMIPLVEKYIASLPKGKKATEWTYRNDGLVKGEVVNDFEAKMETPMVTVAQVYNVDTPYSEQAEVNYEALSYILNMIYTETLREEEGGTYGASAYANVLREPHENAALQVVFQTNVDQADQLRKLARQEFEKVAADGPTAEMFDKAKKNLEKTLSERRQNLSYWNSALTYNCLYGDDYDTEYEKAVKALTPDMVRDAAKTLIESGNFIELVMRPESE